MEGLDGLIESEIATAGVTVKTVPPDIDCAEAEIVVVPARIALATPAPLTLATLEADELHVTDWVRS
jgi:hypothetical protein